MDEWDRPPHPVPRRRPAAVGALLVLAVAGGLFVRAGALDGATGSLDVVRDADEGGLLPEDPLEPPAAGDEPRSDRERDPGEPAQADRDDVGGDLRSDRTAQGALPGDGAPGGGAAAGSWEMLPDAPIAGRAGHSLTWSGDELLVWGGTTRADGGRGEFFADGAAYDPRAGRWRTLPPGPLERRSGPAAAWTGDELVVWGGVGATAHFADGAAYDPEADSWREITASPLAPRQRPATVWTGDELLVLGGFDFAGALRSAAAYSPAEDSWRPVADLPEAFASAWNLDGAWVGDAAVVWAEHADHAAPGARYEPSTDRWTMLPAASRRGSVAAAWTGEDLLLLRGSALIAWRPGDDEWEARQAPWGSSEPWVNRAHWTGEQFVVVRGANQPRVDVYDPGTGTWKEGSALPDGVGYGPTVWSGSDLLTWGGSEWGDPGRDAAGAAFRPGDAE